MGYDYSGYGASTGKPSEYDTYADIEAAYECLQTDYGVGQEDLILYGQSVGSGPTLHLASKLPRLRERKQDQEGEMPGSCHTRNRG